MRDSRASELGMAICLPYVGVGVCIVERHRDHWRSCRRQTFPVRQRVDLRRCILMLGVSKEPPTTKHGTTHHRTHVGSLTPARA